MSQPPQDITKEYATVLEALVAGRREAILARAYELGRRAVQEGLGLLDLASIHHASLTALLGHPGHAQESLRVLSSAGEILREALSPFEMVHRGVREAYGKMREAKEFLEGLVGNSPSMIFKIDARNDRALYVSPNTEAIVGYAAAEIKSSPSFWTDRIHPEDQQAFWDGNKEAIAARLPLIEEEYRFLHKDGGYRWIYGLTHFEYDEAGAPLYLYGYSVDITERKAAEETIAEAKGEAERANLAKNEFLSRMSHELRTPLNAILGFAQLLEIDTLTPEQSENVDYILKGGRHLLQLINEVLDISRIEAGRLGVSPEPVHVGEALDDAVSLIRPLAEEATVSLHTIPVAADVFVQADQQRLRQILLNLLSNAVKYNHSGGHVEVGCETVVGGRLRISVTDTGPGIAPEEQEKLFVPFTRLSTSTPEIEGAGIGLALTRGLVELLGGQIGVKSRPGEGSTFWIELPVVEGQRDLVEPDLRKGISPEHDGRGEKKILYIEDNLLNLELIQRVLNRWPGITLIPAMQGSLGLYMAREQHPDLILLDLHLPDVRGDELLKRIRADPETTHIPVVVISAEATPGDVDRMLTIGASAYLTKPLDVAKLLGVLESHLISPPMNSLPDRNQV